MKIKKIQEIFEEGIKNIKQNGFPTFQKYLDMCATGNLFSLPYENQVLVFQQKKNASFLCSYERWKQYGKIPKSGSAIYLFPTRKNDIKWCFDIKDTIRINNTMPEYEPPEFSPYDGAVLFTLFPEVEQVTWKDCIKILIQTYVRDIFKTEHQEDIPENLEFLTYLFSSYVIFKRMRGTLEISEDMKKRFSRIKSLLFYHNSLLCSR